MIIKSLKRIRNFILTAIFSLIASQSMADKIELLPSTHAIYFGAFGGMGNFTTDTITQTATIFGTSSFPAEGNGKGSSQSASAIGAYIGYKWPELFLKRENAKWTLVPSSELEGYYLKGSQSEDNLNDTLNPQDIHSFLVSYPMGTSVFLANAVLTLNHKDSNIHPYIGAGLGTAQVSITGATSTQIAPPEPGINHYNSDPDASDWTFAAQSKLGLRFNITAHSSIFAEYRFLYLAPTYYTFGSTQYSTHAATSNWNVDISSMCYNLGVIGIQYDI